MSAGLESLVVGTMCHCDDPDDCYDHWELFTEPKGYDPETGHLRQGCRPSEAQLREIVRCVGAVAVTQKGKTQ